MRELDERIMRAVGVAPVDYRPASGGYTSADRFVVTLEDGRHVFVKSADAENLAHWLRREHVVYEALAGSFIPELFGWDDDGTRPVLVLEDLSGADWSMGWNDERIRAIRAALVELARQTAPPDTKSVRETFPHLFETWQVVAADPEPFLSLRLRDASWLEGRLPRILEAAAAAPVEGDELCHLDVRSDNICFRDGRAVLVDWNWSSFANPVLDLAAWAPSVRLEGGPPPWEIVPDGGELAAFVAGVWAAVAGLPPPATAPTVRDMQRRQLAVALDWLDRELA
jgi:thiamine kinase-like enzyme